jgi:hypothetical protein
MESLWECQGKRLMAVRSNTSLDRKRFDRAEADLRQLIDGGASVGDALRVLHNERKIGTMFLIPAVMAVCGVEKKEAMRTVVHETSPYARPV